MTHTIIFEEPAHHGLWVSKASSSASSRTLTHVSRSTHDTSIAISKTFAHSDITQSQLAELQPFLGAYVDKHSKGDEHASSRIQEELRSVYKAHVQTDTRKLGPFMTTLKALRPSMVNSKDATEWFDTAVKAFVEQLGSRKDSIQDAQDFVVGAMLYDEEAPDAKEKAAMSASMTHKLLEEYISRTQLLASGSETTSFRVQNQAQQQLQAMLLAFGRKQPKDLFHALDHFLLLPATRFQALHLLSAWLQQQQAHLDLVVHTPVVEHLLKCLMNDRSTAVVSVALQCLIMLMPHIPATVSTQLPRLFLIYSRCLCWEKFSASSSKAQKDHVTDSRVRRGSESGEEELFSIDPTWKLLDSVPGSSETSTPEILSYFTYLYGLYPLNFMSYIRKPRKYLKNIDFPGADDFDLDQAVIRSRTEQFQRAHLLHSSFFTTTVEEELSDNKWLKAEPSEVVSECLGLYVGSQFLPNLPGPPPAGKLPAPPVSPLVAESAKWQGMMTGVKTFDDDSPILGPVGKSPSLESSAMTTDASTVVDELSRPSTATSIPFRTAGTDAAYLQRELLSVRSELNFERYLKQQHVAAIGQLKRDRIKAVTMEAETATLINANKALQKKLGDSNKLNEKMQKETQSRKTHTRQSEDQLTAKIRSLRSGLSDQESLQASLVKATDDCNQLRQLLVESEARELRVQQELEYSGRHAEEVESLRVEIAESKKRLHMYQDRELQVFEKQAEHNLMQRELDTMRIMVANRDQEKETSKQAFQSKITELEARLALAESRGSANGSASEEELEARLADAQAKYLSIQRAYTRVTQELTELRIKYEDLVAATGMEPDGPGVAAFGATRLPPHSHGHGSSNGNYAHYGPQDLYQGPPVGQIYREPDVYMSRSYEQRGMPFAPNGQSFPPNRPMRPEAYEQKTMNTSPLSRSEGTSYHNSPIMSSEWERSQRGGGSNAGTSFSASKELIRDRSQSAFSLGSEDSSVIDKDMVQAKSEKRVYGRGKSTI